MSSVRKRYCVFGCAQLGAYMHSFPHPERRSDMFKKWLSIVGNKLKERDPMKIYKNKKVCHHHFTSDQKVASHRLMYSAEPCLHLNGVFLCTAIEVQQEHNYCIPELYTSNIKPKRSTGSLMQLNSTGVTIGEDTTMSGRGGRGSHRKCEICGIKERQQTGAKLLFSQFPLNEDRCKAWLRAVGNEELVHLPIEKLHQLRHVCQKHFQRKDFNKKNNRMKKRAIPMLNLTAPPLTDEQLIGFPQRMWMDRNVAGNTSLVPQDVENTLPVPSTSQLGQMILSQNVSGSSSLVHQNVENTLPVQSTSQLEQIRISHNENSYHQFPHPEKNPDCFKAWVHISGGKLDSPTDYELYRKKVICDLHFTDRDRNRNNRLNFIAVPSLHLPVSGSQNVLNESNVKAKKHSYSSASRGKTKRSTTQSIRASTSFVPQPSTSKEPQREEVLRNEIDLPVCIEDSEMRVECDLEIESCTDDLPPPEPMYSWQSSDAIVLADDETDTPAWVNDPNDVGDLSMYNDDVHQLPISANQQKGENAVDTSKEEDKQMHLNYSCNLCKKSISGFRYTCVQCANFDLCAACEAGGAHAAHYVLRIPRPTAHGEVEAVLECIRKNLFDKTDDAVAGASGDLLDEIKTEAEDNDSVHDEIMSLPSIVEQTGEDEVVVDPSLWETETRASTPQSDSSSDMSAVRTELPVLRSRKRKIETRSDDPLRIESAASHDDDTLSRVETSHTPPDEIFNLHLQLEEPPDETTLAQKPTRSSKVPLRIHSAASQHDDVTLSRAKTPHTQIPEDIFNLHLQLEETPDETALAQQPTRSSKVARTYAVITQKHHGKFVKLTDVKVNINRLTKQDINAAIHKNSSKR